MERGTINLQKLWVFEQCRKGHGPRVAIYRLVSPLSLLYPNELMFQTYCLAIADVLWGLSHCQSRLGTNQIRKELSILQISIDLALAPSSLPVAMIFI